MLLLLLLLPSLCDLKKKKKRAWEIGQKFGPVLHQGYYMRVACCVGFSLSLSLSVSLSLTHTHTLATHARKHALTQREKVFFWGGGGKKITEEK